MLLLNLSLTIVVGTYIGISISIKSVKKNTKELVSYIFLGHDER